MWLSQCDYHFVFVSEKKQLSSLSDIFCFVIFPHKKESKQTSQHVISRLWQGQKQDIFCFLSFALSCLPASPLSSFQPVYFLIYLFSSFPILNSFLQKECARTRLAEQRVTCVLLEATLNARNPGLLKALLVASPKASHTF